MNRAEPQPIIPKILDRFRKLGESLKKIDQLITESVDMEDERDKLESEILKCYNEWYELWTELKEFED